MVELSAATASMIEGIERKIESGSQLMVATSESFAKVATSTAKVGELIGEIAAASQEQAQGIEQVNKAVIEVDKVTQQNAANAQQSASASAEMNAQAEQIKNMVKELVALVEGRNKRIAESAVGVAGTPDIKTKNELSDPEGRPGKVFSAESSSGKVPEKAVTPDADDFKGF